LICLASLSFLRWATDGGAVRRSRWRAGGGSFNLDLFLAGRIWRLLRRIWRLVEDFARNPGRRYFYFAYASLGEATPRPSLGRCEGFFFIFAALQTGPVDALYM
jgi:hypothetical protein